MSLSGPVLVATDLSDPADEAIRQGAALAESLGATLLLCHVLPELSQVRVLFPHLAGADEEALTQLIATAGAAVRERALSVTARPVRDEEIFIETGSPHAAIRALADKASVGVVVVGHGATAARLAHQATWSVLVARRSPVGGDVLGATDFSDPALPAVETAVAEAARRSARLRLLHAVNIDVAVPALVMGPPMYQPMSPEAEAAVVDRARHGLHDALRRFDASGELVVARGPAAPAIVEDARARPTSLVVVGTHGRTGLYRMLLGSVADNVLRDAPCSVLAVPLRRS